MAKQAASTSIDEYFPPLMMTSLSRSRISDSVGVNTAASQV